MTFTGMSAGVVAAIGAAASLLAVLLYLLRPRERKVPVPFYRLWRDALGRERPNAWLRRLRGIIGLLLVLAILWLIASSLGRPIPGIGARAPRPMILLVDAGAAMQARPGDTSYIEEARRQAKILVRKSSAPEIALLSFDSEVRVISPLVSSRRQLLSGIDDIETSDCPGNLEKAFTVARSLASAASADIVLLGADVTARRLRQADVPEGLRFMNIADGADNLAITAFAMRPSFTSATDYETMLRLANFTPDERRVTLKLLGQRDGGETLIDAASLAIAAGEEKTLFFPSFGEIAGSVVARLYDADGTALRDALALDNEAYLYVHHREPVRVLLVSTGNLFLESALLADPLLLPYKTPPGEPASAKEFPVVIIDGRRSASVSDARCVIELPHDEDIVQLPESRRVSPGALEAVPDSAVFAGVPIKDVFIARAMRLDVLPGDAVLARGTSGDPLIVERTTRQGKRYLVAFDLSVCEWPLRISFPLFWANLLRAASGEWIKDPYSAVACGTSVTVDVADAKQATLTGPDGVAETISKRDGAFVATPRKVGFYTVTAGPARRRFGANLLAARASDLSACDDPGPVERLSPADAATPTIRLSVTSLWKLLAVGALALLAVEWYTFTRRWTV